MAPVSDEVTEHLGHEERVAVGLAVHRMGKTYGGVVEGVPGGGFHERPDAGVVESGQLDAGHAVLSVQRRQRLDQRMGRVTARCLDTSRAPATASAGRR